MQEEEAMSTEISPGCRADCDIAGTLLDRAVALSGRGERTISQKILRDATFRSRITSGRMTMRKLSESIGLLECYIAELEATS